MVSCTPRRSSQAPPTGVSVYDPPWLKWVFEYAHGIALVAARTSADWFHEVVVLDAQTLLFPNGKTKFVRPRMVRSAGAGYRRGADHWQDCQRGTGASGARVLRESRGAA
jgi:hypothetical protein